MRLIHFLFSVFCFFLLSCQQEVILDNPSQGEFLVQEKMVENLFPFDTAIIKIERDANKQWIRISGNQSGHPMDYEVIANRDPNGKITKMRTIDMHTYFGVYDTSYQTLFYVGNSDVLEYALSKDKDGSGLPRVDSFRYFYDIQGRCMKYEYYTTNVNGTVLYSTIKFEYDAAGNVTKHEFEHYNPTDVSITSYEYDLTKKSPAVFNTVMGPLLILPMDYFSTNLVKKELHTGTSYVDSSQVDFAASQFNSFSRPIELKTETYFGPVKRFFFYQ
jgi:hypothetical protein